MKNIWWNEKLNKRLLMKIKVVKIELYMII